MTDLDGTLLPFVTEDFVRIYFSELCKRLAPLGYEPEPTVKSVWAGTGAMIKNDGSKTNREVFWETFRALNAGKPDAKPVCDDFYTHEFDKAREALKYEPNCKSLIMRLKDAGLKVVIATNPIFPLSGILTRMAWAGLSERDVDYITHYDNSSFCKPNTKYYEEILAAIGERPENCVMMGNSVAEDMVAEQIGIKTFLVPEFLENPQNEDYTRFRQGTLAEAVDFALSLK